METEDILLAIAAGAAVFLVSKMLKKTSATSGTLGSYLIPGSGTSSPITAKPSSPWLAGAPVSALASLFGGGSSASTDPKGAWMGGAPVSAFGSDVPGGESPDSILNGFNRDVETPVSDDGGVWI